MEQLGDDSTTVIWGDALSALDVHVPDRSVDLLFADPPYNIGKRFGNTRDRWPTDEAYFGWCREWLTRCLAKLKPTGSAYIMASTQSMPYFDLFLRDRLTILSRIVWSYDSSGVQARRYFGSMYEPILFAVVDAKSYTFNADAIKVQARTGAVRKLIDYRKAVPTPYNDEKVPGNVWSIPRVRYRMDEYEEHPSQKPETLLERVIKASSNPGDTVLDPFSGTFTTSAVAKRLGRKSIGIELEEQFVKIGLRRLGLAHEWRGEALKPLDKTYERRNGVSARARGAKQSGVLFEAAQ
ncbi:MAG: adenine-specific DNA-methyltransferase [Phycisphaerales bacterium]|nr:adenine-specific DNA-methyltransferase [Phycisphaerales bacterium]